MFTWVTSSSGELTVTITANAITLKARLLFISAIFVM